MEDKSSGSRQDNRGMLDRTGSKVIIKTCIIRSCNEPADLYMCTKHLECTEKDNFKILDGIEIKPSKAPVSKSKKIKLVNALMAISPKKLMDMDGRKWQRYMKKLNKTLKANCGNVQVIELECNKDGDHYDYYSESEIDGHRSSENFRVFQPNNKTQIVIDKGSCQLLELTLNNLFNLTAICGNVQNTAWELILELAIILVVD
jgi:hypothetical protein